MNLKSLRDKAIQSDDPIIVFDKNFQEEKFSMLNSYDLRAWKAADKYINHLGFIFKTTDGYCGQVFLEPSEYFGSNVKYAWGPSESEVKEKLKQEFLERQDKILELDSDDFAKLAFYVKGFDKYYEMSDDHRSWTAGKATHDKIKALCKKLGLKTQDVIK